MTFADTHDAFRDATIAPSRVSKTVASSTPLPITKDLKRRTQAAAAAAAANAHVVDLDARFPKEAFAALKTQRLLGILVPAEFGGEGATISETVDVCYALGRACASTGMIYAMHQIMVACLMRHGRDSAWHQQLLRKIHADQLLLASSTTEGQGGGDLRKSDCAVERNGQRIALTKSATVISYGAEADALVTTARKSPEVPSTDQVLVAFMKSDYRLKHLVDWDTLGMRGTCSAGFTLEAQGGADQILPESYHTIHSRTVMPVAHLMWSAVWAGAAAGAVERARAFIRSAARKSGGQLPPGAAHLTRAVASLATLRGVVGSALEHYEAIKFDEQQIEALDFQTVMNLLKVNASELAISIVASALQACGLAGYRNDGEFSVARHLRDVQSSSIMINNDRILGNVASASLLVDVPGSLTGWAGTAATA